MAEPWWRTGAIYQIYPRSFQDSDGDGVGDLAGIESRLDYLSELGVAALWLSPIQPSPGADFGYDISDYRGIDPLYGDLDGFRALLEAAHRRRLKVIVDLVVNHTSDRHPWFEDSRSSRTSSKRDWYIWHQGRRPPNNWGSVFGGSAWTRCEQTGDYYLHSFLPEQPDLNWRNAEVREAVHGIMRYWLDMGVDGFRLDVFNCYFKDEGLRSNPRRWHPLAPFSRFFRQEHVFDRDQPEMADALRAMRALVDSYPDRCMVGEPLDELFEYRNAHEYYGWGDQLHLVFNFELLHSKWSARRFQNVIRRWLEAVPEGCWPTWVVSNHDFVRSRTKYGDSAGERSKLVALIVTALKGTPFIYYGQEIGMSEQRIPRSRIVDPVGKRYWPVLKGRDGCRTPMQWTGDAGAGFTTGEPWLPLGHDYRDRNVRAQMRGDRSLWATYRELLELRRELPAMAIGDIEMSARQPRWGLMWRRHSEDQRLLVVVNMTPGHQNFTLPDGYQLVFDTHRRRTDAVERLEPYEGLIARAA